MGKSEEAVWAAGFIGDWINAGFEELPELQSRGFQRIVAEHFDSGSSEIISAMIRGIRENDPPGS